MVGRPVSFWNGPFSGAMLVSGRVVHDSGYPPISSYIFVIAHTHTHTPPLPASSFQWQLPGFAEQIGLGVVASKGVKHRETWKGYLEDHPS